MVGTIKSAIAARSIGALLKDRRKAAGLSVREVARRATELCSTGIDHTKVSRYENGRLVPPPRHLAAIGAVVGMTNEEIGGYLADEGSGSVVHWIATKRIPQGTQLQALRAFEDRANKIVHVAPTLIPGWFQTPAYTQAIMRSGGLAAWEIEERLRIRADRARILVRKPNPVTLESFVGEEALLRRVGTDSDMYDQLLELYDWAHPDRANVVIRIIPRSAGWYPGLASGFMILDLDSGTIVHNEQLTTGQFYDDPMDVQEYLAGVDTVRGMALSPEDSRDLIATTAHLYESSEDVA